MSPEKLTQSFLAATKVLPSPWVLTYLPWTIFKYFGGISTRCRCGWHWIHTSKIHVNCNHEIRGHHHEKLKLIHKKKWLLPTARGPSSRVCMDASTHYVHSRLSVPIAIVQKKDPPKMLKLIKNWPATPPTSMYYVHIVICCVHASTKEVNFLALVQFFFHLNFCDLSQFWETIGLCTQCAHSAICQHD